MSNKDGKEMSIVSKDTTLPSICEALARAQMQANENGDQIIKRPTPLSANTPEMTATLREATAEEREAAAKRKISSATLGEGVDPYDVAIKDQEIPTRSL